MANLGSAIRRFLFEPQSTVWLSFLRIGIGLQLFFYVIAMRSDWIELLAEGNRGLIRRDLMEALLSAESPFIPRVGWIVEAGGWLHLGETNTLWLLWSTLLVASLLLLLGLFCRTAGIIAWILFLCTAKTVEPFGYGVDNFTVIGLFYLAIAPVPDTWSIDARWRRIGLKSTSLQGLHRRVLQLHLCLIYFFSGVAKCAGPGWWNGISLWRALTRPPFNVIPAEIVIRFGLLLPLAGILVCVMEATYPIFVWPRKTRLIWFIGVLGLHVGIGMTMGMYLFAWVMIVLNMAAFGPEFSFALPAFPFNHSPAQRQAETSST